MKTHVLSALFLMSGLCLSLFPGTASAQTNPRGVLIVNEISNGVSGTKEFVELIPAVCEDQPGIPMDLSNWIVDDNNGIFNSDPAVAGANLGISSGHLRFVNNSFWQNYPADRLIVLFNGADYDSTNIDFVTASANASTTGFYDNGTGIFIAVGFSPLVEYTTFAPTTTTSTYCAGQSYIIDTPAWNSIGLRNSELGDGIQVRCPGCGGLNNGEPAFYHGVAYGDTTIAAVGNFFLGAHIGFPANDTNAAGFPIGGTNRTFFFSGGHPSVSSNWSIAPASAATPGMTNDSANAAYFSDVLSGVNTFECCAIDTTVAPPDTTASASDGILIITEISNGPTGGTGTCEYIELIVAACGASEADSVDIRGWIVDDNSGNFNNSRTCGTGIGISTGYLRFAYDDVWAKVPVGSVIVLFNGQDNCYNFVDDTADNNLDGKYFIKVGTNPYIERNTTTPNASGPVCDYCVGAYAVVTSAWNTVGLSNTADAAQVRCPGCVPGAGEPDFFHGFGYGTGFSGFAPGAADLGGAYISGSGSGRKYEFFQGNEAGVSANWRSTAANASGTPPATAGVVFAAFKDSVVNGLYDFPCCSYETGLGKKAQTPSPFKSQQQTGYGVKEGSAILYPNPAGSFLNLDINRVSGYTVTLIDITGKVVYNKAYQATQGTATIQLDLRELPAGVYVYSINSQGNEETLSGRLVIKK